MLYSHPLQRWSLIDSQLSLCTVNPCLRKLFLRVIFPFYSYLSSQKTSISLLTPKKPRYLGTILLVIFPLSTTHISSPSRSLKLPSCYAEDSQTLLTGAIVDNHNIVASGLTGQTSDATSPRHCQPNRQPPTATPHSQKKKKWNLINAKFGKIRNRSSIVVK